MIDLDYVARQLAGVWKMTTGDAGWREDLDLTADGVFRSFGAVLFALPLSLALYFLYWRAAQRVVDIPKSDLLAAGPLGFFAAQLATTLADWALSVCLLIAFARTLSAERRIADVIVGFNWAQLLIIFIQIIPMAALATTGQATTGALLGLPAMALQLAILWGVLRRGFEKDAGPTVVMLAALIAAGLFVSWLVGVVAMAVG